MPPRSIHFVTCVNDSLKYDSCRASIESLRPEGLQVSADVIENMDGRYSSAAALNLGRERSRADLIVFCHQDVVFPEEWLALLLASIEQVALRDDPWAVIGPMGRVGKRYFGHALGADGKATFHGPLPEQVETLDEFCLVVPAGLSLRFDERLGGHHLYGVDLCLAALEAGKAAYAIDAPCQHNSSTRHRPPEYHTIKRRLQRKWMFARRKVGRSVGTTCGRIRFGLFEGWI
jgi:GT2 family glycosyltransferase